MKPLLFVQSLNGHHHCLIVISIVIKQVDKGDSLGIREIPKKRKKAVPGKVQFIKTLILKKPYFQTRLRKITSFLNTFIVRSALLEKNSIIYPAI